MRCQKRHEGRAPQGARLRVGETLWRVIFLNDFRPSGRSVRKPCRLWDFGSGDEGARVGILETCGFQIDVRQGGKPHEGHRSRAGLRRSWDGDPEGGSKSMGGVGTSVPSSEAAKTAEPSKRNGGRRKPMNGYAGSRRLRKAGQPHEGRVRNGNAPVKPTHDRKALKGRTRIGALIHQLSASAG